MFTHHYLFKRKLWRHSMFFCKQFVPVKCFNSCVFVLTVELIDRSNAMRNLNVVISIVNGFCQYCGWACWTVSTALSQYCPHTHTVRNMTESQYVRVVHRYFCLLFWFVFRDGLRYAMHFYLKKFKPHAQLSRIRWTRTCFESCRISAKRIHNRCYSFTCLLVTAYCFQFRRKLFTRWIMCHRDSRALHDRIPKNQKKKTFDVWFHNNLILSFSLFLSIRIWCDNSLIPFQISTEERNWFTCEISQQMSICCRINWFDALQEFQFVVIVADARHIIVAVVAAIDGGSVAVAKHFPVCNRNICIDCFEHFSRQNCRRENERKMKIWTCKSFGLRSATESFNRRHLLIASEQNPFWALSWCTYFPTLSLPPVTSHTHTLTHTAERHTQHHTLTHKPSAEPLTITRTSSFCFQFTFDGVRRLPCDADCWLESSTWYSMAYDSGRKS